MGSYIAIGLVTNQEGFNKKTIEVIKLLDQFNIIGQIFPDNGLHSGREMKEPIGIDQMVNFCENDDMIFFRAEFYLGGYNIKNALLSVEKHLNDKCFLIQILEDGNKLFEDIDRAEKIICDYFARVSHVGFSIGFCDTEAHFMEPNYAIHVTFIPEFMIKFESWKIDGFSDRKSDLRGEQNDNI